MNRKEVGDLVVERMAMLQVISYIRGRKRVIVQDAVSPPAFVFPRPLSVDLSFENGGVLEQSEVHQERHGR
jgi:hypothetical protein